MALTAGVESIQIVSSLSDSWQDGLEKVERSFFVVSLDKNASSISEKTVFQSVS